MIHPLVQSLLDQVALQVPGDQEAAIVGKDPVMGYRFPVGEAAAAVLAAGGVAASDAWALKTGRRQRVSVDVRRAAVSLLPAHAMRINGGPPPPQLGHDNPLVDMYQCRDGRWVHLQGCLPHFGAGTLKLLGCEQDSQQIAASMARWDAQELEDALADARLCGAKVRTVDEWAAHAQGRAIGKLPSLEIIKLGDSAPEPFPPGPRPLSGVRVLDLTRILAGPTHARTLAQYGAEVLHITSPKFVAADLWTIDTQQGKLSAYLDLDQSEGVARLRDLVKGAHVFANGYRTGSLGRRGLGPEELSALRPGIIYVSINCYGHDGPWRERPGWDQLAQSVSGIAAAQGSPERPKRMPVIACDYTTGYLAALGTLVALGRRARVGGSYLVRASLTQTAMWFTRLGATCDPSAAAGAGDLDAMTADTDTEWGRVTQLAPVVELSETPARWERPPVPLGTHAPSWLA